MKTKITALLLSLAFAAQAQLGPYEQFFNKTLFQDLPDYDSITVWYYSKTPVNLAAAMDISMGNDGKIDSMIYHDLYINQDAYLYSGKRVGNTNVIVGYDNYSGTPEPVERTSFIYDQQNRINQIFFASFNGNYFDEVSMVDIGYNADGSIDSMVISFNMGMLGYMPLAEYEYEYVQGKLKTVTFREFGGGVIEMYVLQHLNNGEVERIDILEDVNGDDLIELTRKIQPLYQAGGIHILEEYWYDSLNGNYHLDEILEYSLKNGGGGSVGTTEENTFKLAIFPNPAHEFLQVKGRDLRAYKLYDRNGVGVQKGKLTGTIDVSKLAPGIYILQVINGNGKSQSVKFIKK